MSELKKYIVVIILCVTGGLVGKVQAHQQKEAISTILFNARTGNMEIAHRFYIHDAEHAAKKILNEKADLLKDKVIQAAFSRYIVERFSLTLNQDSNLSVKLVGHEVEGKFFWVYQELTKFPKPKSIQVTYDALMEIWPSQRNVINIEGLGDIQSIELFASTPSKTLIF